MGSILLWLGRGLYLGGGTIIGIFFEKISNWVAGILPASVNTRGKDGGPAAWFVAAIAIASGVVLYIITKMITGKKKLFTLALLATLTALDMIFLDGGFEVMAASLLFQIAGASTDTKSVAYFPEYIAFTIATVPTSIKIECLGQTVVFDMTGTGITNMNGVRLLG